MTDAEIVIGVRGEVSGGRQIQRTLDDIANSSDKASRSTEQLGNSFTRTKEKVDNFTKAMRALAAALFLRELARLSDGFVNIENKLKVVTGSTQEFSQAMNDVQSIAQNTFASLEGTASTYSRMAIATKNLGLSQGELKRIVEATNNTFRLSGATTTEVAAASIQLAQGLASGALRGDELRSVLENNAVLGNLLAEAFNTNVGALRDMAAEGLITADVVANVLLKSFDDLQIKTAEMIPTIGQSFTQLYNSIQTFIGQSEVLRGIANAVSTSVQFLADNFSGIATALGLAAIAFGSYIIATNAAVIATRVMSTATIAFNAVLAANPIGLFIAAIVAVGTAAYVFRDEIYDYMVKPVAAMIITVDTAITKIQEFYDAVRGGFDGAVAAVLVATGQIDSETAGDVLLDRKNARPKRQNRIDPNDLIGGIDDVLNRNKVPTAGGGATIPQQPKQVMDELAKATQGASKEIKAANDNSKELDDTLRQIKENTDRFSNSAADTFTKFISGTLSAKDALRSLANDILQMASRQLITQPLSNGLSSILGGGSGGGILGSLFGGFGGAPAGNVVGPTQRFGLLGSIAGAFGFADGGSMRLGGKSGNDQNVLSLNGEPIARTGRGEVLSISPNGGNGNSGGVTVNQVINVSTGVVDTVRAEVISMLPRLKEAAIAGVKEADLRGYA